MPAHKLRVVLDELDRGDFRDMSSENIDWARRETLWIYKARLLAGDKAHVRSCCSLVMSLINRRVCDVADHQRSTSVRWESIARYAFIAA
jgi:hypothetical protein